MEFEGAEGTAAGALIRLALTSTTLHPDEISAAVAAEVARAGLGEAALYLACLEQRELLPLSARRSGGPEGIDIDGSAAGTAYRTEEPVVESGADGVVRAWLPLMDSAERLGVMSLRTEMK